MQTFRREGAAYVAQLEAPERAVLLEVVDDVVDLLATRDDGEAVATGAHTHPLDALHLQDSAVEAPTDPALLRLLPDASTEPTVAAELRRYTESDLRRTKADHLLRLRAGVDAASPDLVVVPSEAAQVAAALTDVRLVASERLGVRSDADADALYRLVLDPDDTEDDNEAAHRLLATVYVILSFLQESLVELMLRDLPGADARGGDGPAPAGGPGRQH